MRQGLADQHGDGHFIDDVAVLVRQAILAVGGVGIEGDVGQDAQLGKAAFQGLDRARHQAVRVGRFDAVVGFQRRVDDGKQGDHGDAERHAIGRHLQQQIDRDALDARHRCHLLALVFAIENEHRIDQVVRRDGVFTHQRARERIAAHAAQADGGVGGRSVSRHFFGLKN